MSAAYDCDIQLTDDETFLFNLSITNNAGNPPVWADYIFEYAMDGSGFVLNLTEGDGIVIDEINNLLTIGPTDRTYRLRPGKYRHGLLATDINTDTTTQFFDGTVTVTEGNFR